MASVSEITFSSRTYLPSRRAKLPYARGWAEDFRNTPSGAIDAASEPNETQGRRICFLMLSSRIGTIYFLMREDNIKKQIRQPGGSFGADAESIARQAALLISSAPPRAHCKFGRRLGH